MEFTPTCGVSSQEILQGKETHLNFLSNGRGEGDLTFVQEQDGLRCCLLAVPGAFLLYRILNAQTPWKATQDYLRVHLLCMEIVTLTSARPGGVFCRNPHLSDQDLLSFLPWWPSAAVKKCLRVQELRSTSIRLVIKILPESQWSIFWAKP